MPPLYSMCKFIAIESTFHLQNMIDSVLLEYRSDSDILLLLHFNRNRLMFKIENYDYKFKQCKIGKR